MSLTLNLPDTTIEELAALHPRATCSPRLGPNRVLPAKSTPTSGRMEWNWSGARHPIIIDHCLIRIGDRAWTARLVDTPDGILTLAARQPLTLVGYLHDYR